jgi:hypothetical protein
MAGNTWPECGLFAGFQALATARMSMIDINRRRLSVTDTELRSRPGGDKPHKRSNKIIVFQSILL